MELVPASRYSTAEVTAIWNLGYANYFVPINFTEAQMEQWIRNGDLDMGRSADDPA